ncbi:hypothetical protein F511_18346 [Dorcoceras hygrometricum]|uniref:Uncharacterized protein n=1 Tax=Dorcoceras hygrometricum TaxID=472368 RepID=A0A2Z7C4X3_9LAMI|nr:hypothetical protein F511_18346 [Dorcoceras hygrometricum]
MKMQLLVNSASAEFYENNATVEFYENNSTAEFYENNATAEFYENNATAERRTFIIVLNLESGTCVTLNGSGIQLDVGPQPLWFRNQNSGLAHRIMYGPFNPYIPIISTTIGKSRVAKDPIAMRTSWRSNSDIASVTSIGYPRMSASGESSTTMHRLLHASGSHPIPTPYDPKRVGKRVKVRRLSCRVSMTFES